MEISDLKSANMHLTRYYTLHPCSSLDCKTAGGQTLRSASMTDSKVRNADMYSYTAASKIKIFYWSNGLY